MMARVRRLPLMLVACALLAAAPALAAGGSNRVVGNCEKSQVKPKSIILACADVNDYVDKISWKTFGGATAQGSGDFVQNNCKPDCAAGHFLTYAVTFALTEAKPCFDRYDDYRLISMTFVASRPPQTPSHTQEQLFCPVG